MKRRHFYVVGTATVVERYIADEKLSNLTNLFQVGKQFKFFFVERTKGIAMPNLSKRQQELNKMVKELERRRNLRAFRYLMDCEDNIEDNIDKMMEVMYQTAITKQYMFRWSSNQSKPCCWKALLEKKHLLNDCEFLHAF